MKNDFQIYCIDANVLIQAWDKYYSPVLCPDYWNVLNELGLKGLVYIPEEVYNEIIRSDDELSDWLKQSKIPIRKISESVVSCLQKVYANIPIHQNLVDNIKGRSLADPWIIAHAMNEGATVVTKEEKVTATNSNRIRIPNVCDNMGIRWINDFEFLKELNIRFSCKLMQ